MVGLVLASLLMCTPLVRAAGDGFGPLVSVAWLQNNLGRSDLVLLDASPAPMYAAQHIAGAVNVDIFSYGPLEPPTAMMEQRFQSWGIGAGRKVVLYDPGGSYFAARTLFDLLYRGYPAQDLAILDGGLAKWRAMGGAVTKDATPAPARGTFRITATQEDLRVRLPEFLVASGDPKANALVEALDADWHFGATAFFDRGGHVPNAIMWPTEDLFNADKTFKSPDELRRMALYLGIRPEQQIHTHCGGGVAAAAPFFVLKFLLGYPRVKLYQESQLEWLRDDRGLPFWTYDAPSLLRETAWLKAWGGRMLRQFGVSRVAVVDVRPAEAFALGHLPFAHNVPADVFARQIDQPAKLAELLGQSGVDPTHEAVIVSDGGINERSALAFLALERLGQKRISILLDSTERWAELGQEIARPTAGAMPPAPRPTAYAAAAPRAAAPAAYPKLFVASGKAMPAGLPDGRVIHLPYTALLAADGRPKPAKDIWNILVKAGVPRYAEIVCIGDTLGEAAANYLLFKLMGFADVKVAAL
jgi:3-mercaptopyruvate sulfurtransferase SseA